MLSHLRWQLALAVGGAILIGALLLVVGLRAVVPRPARGGEFTEALVGRVVTLNPIFASGDAEADIVRLLYSGLTRIDNQGIVRPDLATHWAISPDARVYTFTLRADAVWHDGQPITAQDVVFTAEVAGNPDLTGKTAKARAWERAAATAVGPHTVRLTLEEAHAPFLEATTLGLVPAHLLATVSPRDLATDRRSTLEPIGAGPYRIVAPGDLQADTIRLTRFEEHWSNDGRQPFLDAVVFRLYPAAAPALEALAAQGVQAMGGVPASALEELGDDARLYSAVRSGHTVIYLNAAGNSLFADEAVRRALALGVDRDSVIEAAMDGQAVPASGPIPPGSWAHAGDVPALAYDPATARELLTDANWEDREGSGIRDRDGRDLVFRLAVQDDETMVAIARAVAQDWEAIGVRAQVEVLSEAEMAGALRERRFDASLVRWDLRTEDPDPYVLWHSSQIEGGQNYAGYRNADADRLLIDARRAPPDDTELRARLYADFQALLADEVPAVFLFHPVYNYVVADPGVGGVQLPRLITEPADRFLTLPDWYVRTERVLLDTATERRGTAASPTEAGR
jgi:peptide/nickel transport system substrate-binding protein